MIKLSIVILNYNGSGLTLRCLESISPLFKYEDIEIIVVDNGSTNSPLTDISLKYPYCRTLQLSRNFGVGPGRNKGIDFARGEEILVLDNDIIASPQSILDLLEYKRNNSHIGLLAPRLVSPEGFTQISYKKFPGLLVKLRNLLHRGSDIIYNDVNSNADSSPFYVIGAAQMFARSLWEEIGGYDEKIFYGPEDADFCMAVRKCNTQVVYHPSVTLIHDWQRATNKHIFSRLARKHISGLLYFYRKHRRFL